MSTITITIPNVQLTLEELLIAIRQLEPDARSKVAQALVADEIDERFDLLIRRLAEKPPVTDITDEEINDEVRFVCQQPH